MNQAYSNERIDRMVAWSYRELVIDQERIVSAMRQMRSDYEERLQIMREDYEARIAELEKIIERLS